MTSILTIDIGGTEIKSAIYDEQSNLLTAFANQRTAVTATDNGVSQQVLTICRQALAQQTIDGVAIASAGVVNPISGEIIFAGPNIPDYTGTNLKKTVETSLSLPCTVENDVNAMALGEAWQGAAKDCPSALCLTLGTGLGGAVLIDGRLWHGDNFTAGEVGYIPLADGRRLEQVASTSAMLQDYQQKTGDKIDGKTFFQRLNRGDRQADAALDHMLATLAQGLLPAIYLLAPNAIIIGGGITAQKTIVETRLTAAMADKLPAPRWMPKHIRCAGLGNRAGMVGALRCWLLNNNKHES